LTTVHFHKAIRKYTNGEASFTSDGISYFEVIQNCISMFPELEKLFKSFIKEKDRHEELAIIVEGEVLDLDKLWFPAKEDFFLCPLIYGAGKVFKIVAIIAIIVVVAYVAGPALFAGAGAGSSGLTAGALGAKAVGAAGALGGAGTAAAGGGFSLGSFLARQLVSIAVNLALGALAPTPPKQAPSKVSETEVRKNNDSFEGLTNTFTTTAAIPLHYGEVRVAGQFVSGYVKTINHGKDDIIRVVDYF
jgi:hypothetical protein